MAYTQEGIMAQILVAFGQGTGTIRVSQDAALELRRWYFDAITQTIIDQTWETEAVQLLERARAIGSLAAFKATGTGATAISPQNVYDSAATVQVTSMTELGPPPPPPLRPHTRRRPAETIRPFAVGHGAGCHQAGDGAGRVLRPLRGPGHSRPQLSLRLFRPVRGCCRRHRRSAPAGWPPGPASPRIGR